MRTSRSHEFEDKDIAPCVALDPEGKELAIRKEVRQRKKDGAANYFAPKRGIVSARLRDRASCFHQHPGAHSHDATLKSR